MSENAVRIQIYSAIITYCMMAIVQKKMNIERSIYEMMQIVSISLTDTTNLIDCLLPCLLPSPSAMPASRPLFSASSDAKFRTLIRVKKMYTDNVEVELA